MATMPSLPGFDRLPPFGLQLFGEQACADIGASAGAERYDELHDPRRPVLRLLRPRRRRPRRSTTEKTDKFTPPHGRSLVQDKGSYRLERGF
jgi:hypothetical protein